MGFHSIVRLGKKRICDVRVLGRLKLIAKEEGLWLSPSLMVSMMKKGARAVFNSDKASSSVRSDFKVDT